MKISYRMGGLLAAVLCLANPVYAKDASKAAASPPANEAALTKALDGAMTPGEGQKRLEPMIGTFNVTIRTWVEPSKPPIESSGTMVSAWVLGSRYVQSMLAGQMNGEPFNGASCKTRTAGVICSLWWAKAEDAGGHFWHDGFVKNNIITPAKWILPNAN